MEYGLPMIRFNSVVGGDDVNQIDRERTTFKIRHVAFVNLTSYVRPVGNTAITSDVRVQHFTGA